MNILLTQLDHIGYVVGHVECFSCSGAAGDSYLAEGYIVLNFDVRQISIEINWITTLTQVSVKRSEDGFVAEFIPRVELTDCSICNFPWLDQVDEKELEQWLQEFKSSCGLYDEIVECLPLPEIDTMEVDDCFLDRDFPRTGEPDKH